MKRKYRLLSVLLCVGMLFSMLPVNAIAAYVSNDDEFIVPVSKVTDAPEGYTAIYSPSDFYNIRNKPSANYILMRDLDLSSYKNWSSIGSFSGILDGNGYSIKNVTQEITATSSTVFSGIIRSNNGTIKNLGISNASVCAVSTSGVIFGSILTAVNYGTIDNCFVEGELILSVETPEITAGGSICAYNSGTVNYCHSKSSIEVDSGNGAATQIEVGGIVGENTKTLTSSVNSGELIIYNDNGMTFGAGVVGYTSAPVYDCGNLGNVFIHNKTGNVNAGGVTGLIDGNIIINRCFNYGNIQAQSSSGNVYVGGIAGIFNVDSGTTTSSYNYNEGAISAGTEASSTYATAGGIAGALQGYYHLENSYNNGYVRADSKGSNASAGGLVGMFIQNISYGTLECSYNTGKAESSNSGRAGGLVGALSYKYAIISKCVKHCYTSNNASLIGTGSRTEVIENTCINYVNNPGAMKEQSSYPGFDFKNIWTMEDNGYSYPSLQNNRRIVFSDNGDIDFSVLLYRADHLASAISSGDYYEYAFTDEYSSCQAMIEEKGIATGLVNASWEALSTIVNTIKSGGLSVIRDQLEEKDIYGGIILQLLQCDSNLQYVSNISDNSWVRNAPQATARLASAIASAMGTSYNQSDEKKYYDYLKAECQKSESELGSVVWMDKVMVEPEADINSDWFYIMGLKKVFDDAGKTATFLSRVIQTAGSLDNIVNQYMSYISLIEMSENMKTILREMNKNCDTSNYPMKMALSDIEMIVNLKTEEALDNIIIGKQMISAGSAGLSWCYGVIWKEIFNEIKISHPWMAFSFAVYDLAKWVADETLDVSDTVAQYYKMFVVRDVECLVSETLSTVREKYIAERTEANAALFLDAFGMKNRILNIDHDVVIDYLEYDGWINVVDNQAAINRVKNRRDVANYCRFLIETEWLEALKDERPELARFFNGYWIDVWKECKGEYPDGYLDDDVAYEYFLSNRYSGECVEVACPANVYIYGAEGDVLAYATSETVCSDGEITVISSGETKQFYLTGKGNYSVVCEGYDQGDMDIKLTNYYAGEVGRTTYFNNVPVSDESAHTLDVDLGNYNQQELYLIDRETNEIVSPSYDSQSDEQEEYHIEINNGYINSDGTVSCDRQLQAGAVVELSPVIPRGHKFIKWSSTIGDDVFADPYEEFSCLTVPTEDLVVSAVFEPLADTEPVVISTAVEKTSMILGNDLSIMFAFTADDIAGTGNYATITKSYADGTADRVERIEQSAWGDPIVIGGKNYYAISFDGVAAKEMTDELQVQIFNADGMPISEVFTDSIRDYAMRMIENGTSVQMFVDMLVYGAEAQKQFESYGINDLATSQLTAQQLAQATQTVSFENKLVADDGYRASSLILESNIQLAVLFGGIDQTMTAEVSFTDHYGETKKYTIAGSEFEPVTYKGEACYSITIDELVMADARQLVTVTVKDIDGNVVTFATDSVESYIARMSNTGTLYEAIMKFSNSAAAGLKN